MPDPAPPVPYGDLQKSGRAKRAQIFIHKFGGAPITGRRRMSRAASLVAANGGRGAVVVVSALAGVTDALLAASARASRGDRRSAAPLARDLLRRHLALNPGDPEVERRLRRMARSLEASLAAAARRGALGPRERDAVLSFGERMATPLFAAWLRRHGVPAVAMDAGDAGLLTDESFGSASPRPEAPARIRWSLGPLLRSGRVPVVTGFLGRSPRGHTTTLGRGGSDYTATILGAALKAREVWLWKETDGIMSADPRIVPAARPLDRLSYEEAMELSFFGAKILHPRAMEPAMAAGIPVRVRSVLHPESPGTRIGRGRERSQDVVKAVTLIRNVAMLNLSGTDMVGTPGSAGRLFSCLGRAGVNIIMISQGSSERTISMLIEEARLKAAVEALRREFPGNGRREITSNPRVCALAVVGAGMRGTPGVAGHLFSALGRARVNVVMIAQGSSEFNISFVVDRRDAERAVRVVHREFRE